MCKNIYFYNLVDSNCIKLPSDFFQTNETTFYCILKDSCNYHFKCRIILLTNFLMKNSETKKIDNFLKKQKDQNIIIYANLHK